MPNDVQFRWFGADARRTTQILSGRTPVAELHRCLRLTFCLVNGDDGSVVGTIWWLGFYKATPLECVVTFNPAYPPPLKQPRRNK